MMFLFLLISIEAKDGFVKEWQTIEELGSFLTVLERCNCSTQEFAEQLALLQGRNLKTNSQDLLGSSCDCCWNGPLGTACLCPTKLKFKGKFKELSGWLHDQRQRKLEGKNPDMKNYEAAQKSLSYNMGEFILEIYSSLFHKPAGKEIKKLVAFVIC
jgi:hypothetical protein